MDTVQNASKAKNDAEQAYRDALVAARADGRPVASIAEAAGITRSAVYQILEGEAKRRARQRIAQDFCV